MTPSGPDQAWARFHVEYGKAMLHWALVESELATLFSHLTAIAPNMAVKSFYAPRSFKGRADIFRSALTVSDASDVVKAFARSLLKKADQYSNCRNKFAHDQPLLHQCSFPAEFEIWLVDAKGQFQLDHEKKRYLDDAVTTADIADIAVQFMELAQIVRDAWIAMPNRNPPPPSLDKLRERLAALPSLPRPKARSQPPEAP
jgi:hypothetical protein